MIQQIPLAELSGVKNVWANAINFKRTNLNSKTHNVTIGHNVLTANTEQDVVVRFVSSDDFEDIIFDFAGSGTYITQPAFGLFLESQ
jgi:hypothetical protein